VVEDNSSAPWTSLLIVLEADDVSMAEIERLFAYFDRAYSPPISIYIHDDPEFATDDDRGAAFHAKWRESVVATHTNNPKYSILSTTVWKVKKAGGWERIRELKPGDF